MPAHPSKGIPALRSADNRDAPPSSSEDRDQFCMPIANVATLAGSHTSGGWRESDISRLVMSTMRIADCGRTLQHTSYYFPVHYIWGLIPRDSIYLCDDNTGNHTPKMRGRDPSMPEAWRLKVLHINSTFRIRPDGTGRPGK